MQGLSLDKAVISLDLEKTMRLKNDFFVKYITHSTHLLGSLLGHVYIRNKMLRYSAIEAIVHLLHLSDNDAVHVCFQGYDRESYQWI